MARVKRKNAIRPLDKFPKGYRGSQNTQEMLSYFAVFARKNMHVPCEMEFRGQTFLI